MLRGRTTKHWMRALYSLQSIWKLKHASIQGAGYKDYFQAGKSVSGIREIQSAAAIVSDYAAALNTRVGTG
jgi:nitronate monooxygenase